MINLPKFEALWEVVRSMGAKGRVVFEIGDLETTGIEISDLNQLIKAPHGFYRVLNDGTLVKIVLHISDREIKAIKGELGFPKFHLFNCSTIQEMERIGRSHRYKISCRKDGKFRFIIIENRRQKLVQDQELEICKNCLDTYNASFGGSETKKSFVANGHFTKFLKSEIRSGLIKGDFEYDFETIPNAYSSDWDLIARKVKEAKNYSCEKCLWKPTNNENKKYIHAHHIDGKKYNTKYDNIKVLCIQCHANELGHDHLKKIDDFIKFKKIRKTG